MTPCLAIAAKQPERGRVKTRIAAGIGDDRAAELCRCALRDTLALVSRVVNVQRMLSYAPATAEARHYFEMEAPTFELLPQCGADLGRRIGDLFGRLTDRFSPVVLIGSDSPDLPATFIEQAFALLTQADAVLGPADDGGYYLIGLNTMAPALFEGIDWSTDAVAEQTRARASESGLRLAELPRWHDLDTVADLRLLAAPGAPLTRAFVGTLEIQEGS
jgi:rSAM/selenodomain-associated transferase 1